MIVWLHLHFIGLRVPVNYLALKYKMWFEKISTSIFLFQKYLDWKNTIDSKNCSDSSIVLQVWSETD